MNWSFLALLMSFSVMAEGTIVADIISGEDFGDRYERFLSGRSVLEVKDFHPTTQGSHIEIIEMIILQQALYLGGITSPLKFEPKPTVNTVEFTELISGNSLVLARSVWQDDLINYQGSLYISEAVIEFGDYEAGLYIPQRKAALANMPIEQVNKLSVVTNPRWNVDWRALNNTQVNLVSFIGPWETMLKMVENNVVDTMLINFSVSESLILDFEGSKYIPINGIKYILPDSRHFVVSKKHPDGAKVFKALSKGLKILKETGLIRKALTESGFINNKVRDWHILNKHMLTPLNL